jgi:hypothetical protein
MQMPPIQMPQAHMQGPSMQVQGPSVQAQPPQMQMPQMPQVNMAPLAAPKMPDKVPGTGSGPNILLIVIFCLLAFLVGALLMVWLLKPKVVPKPHAGIQTRHIACDASLPTAQGPRG